MEYQTIINFLENKLNQPTKIRTKNCVEISDEFQGTCNSNSQTKFENSVLRLNLCGKNLQVNIYTCKLNYDNYWGRK